MCVPFFSMHREIKTHLEDTSAYLDHGGVIQSCDCNEYYKNKHAKKTSAKSFLNFFAHLPPPYNRWEKK